MAGWLMNGEMDMIWKEAAVAQSRHYIGIGLGE
jgi:hypothetical protein